MTLWWFPLESLDERYTANWSRWFPEQFRQAEVDYVTIPGESLSSAVEEGEFLDIYSRPHFALSQICKFVRHIKAGEVKNGDSLLFADLWHHGIEAIPYIRDLGNKHLKIYGIFHAGSYDPYDFMTQQNTVQWAQHFEKSICEFVNKIFVGSEWSKTLLDYDDIFSHKIKVTGLPLKCDELLATTKNSERSEEEKLVVFPHRFAPEKGIDKMILIMVNVFEHDKNIHLVLTTGRDKLVCRDPKTQTHFERFVKEYSNNIHIHNRVPKKEYYTILKRCHVVLSCALQETFGYGVLEASLLGCTPVVPHDLSYTDTLQNDERLFYSTNEEAVDKILKYVNEPINVSQYAKRYALPNTIGKMLKEMELI